MAIIPIYIPTYINSPEYTPARVQPRLLFYNGMVDCESYYIESGSTTVGGTAFEQTAFPYFDNYNVVTGSFPTVNSKSLLFYNEEDVYGEVPTDSLYSEYWSDYVNLLYNSRTKLLNASAIIPLADYFKIELNDVVEFRGNYYHLRAINDYNLKNGECSLQLLGPILPESLNLKKAYYEYCMGYSISICADACTDYFTNCLGILEYCKGYSADNCSLACIDAQTCPTTTTTTTLAPTTTTTTTIPMSYCNQYRLLATRGGYFYWTDCGTGNPASRMVNGGQSDYVCSRTLPTAEPGAGRVIFYSANCGSYPTPTTTTTTAAPTTTTTSTSTTTTTSTSTTTTTAAPTTTTSTTSTSTTTAAPTTTTTTIPMSYCNEYRLLGIRGGYFYWTDCGTGNPASRMINGGQSDYVCSRTLPTAEPGAGRVIFSSANCGSYPTPTTTSTSTTSTSTTSTSTTSTSTTTSTTTTTAAPTTTTSTTSTSTSTTTTTTGVPITGSFNVEILLVAGGGGSGWSSAGAYPSPGQPGGGGGAGRYISYSTGLATGSIYTMTVGNGGAAGVQGSIGGNGTNTSFNAVVAPGGGAGGDGNDAGPNKYGAAGGSGGGAGWYADGGAAIPGAIQTGSGNPGGNSRPNPTQYFGDSGGGAGGPAGAFGLYALGLTWYNGQLYAQGGAGGRTGYPQLTTSGSGGSNPPSNAAGGMPGLPGIGIIRYLGSPVATGGAITTSGSYTYHTFTSSSNFIT